MRSEGSVKERVSSSPGFFCLREHRRGRGSEEATYQGTAAKSRLWKDGAGYVCDYISKGHSVFQLCMHLVSSGIKLNEDAKMIFLFGTVWYTERTVAPLSYYFTLMFLNYCLKDKEGEKQSITY